MTISLLTTTIVVFVLFSIFFLSAYSKHKWISLGNGLTYMLFVYYVVASVFSPLGADKIRYISDFHDAPYLEFIKDPGWTLLSKILNVLCFDNETLYLLIIAIVYVLGYYVLGKCKLGKQNIAYYLLLSAGCLGFWSGSTNIMRAGFATSLFFLSLCKEEDNKTAYYLLSLAAIFIHNSLLILVCSYFLTNYYKNYKLFTWVWIAFLILSSANVLNPIVEFLSSNMGEVGDRIAEYAYDDSAETADLYRNAGFRVDFVLYSALAIFYSRWIIVKQKYKDDFFERISCTYILVNCFWLVMIRAMYADRFALLSWSLISLIILYPYMNPRNSLPFNSKAITVAFIPVVLELILTMRNL